MLTRRSLLPLAFLAASASPSLGDQITVPAALDNTLYEPLGSSSNGAARTSSPVAQAWALCGAA